MGSILPLVRLSIRPRNAFCLLAALLLVFGPSSLTNPWPAEAATHIGATTYTSNTTWTAAASPYVLDGDVTVAAGATLTVQPGVVVKMNGVGRTLVVNGTLNASGTADSRIYFTSLQDDSIGGDSGGDGTTAGAAGQWLQIKFGAGSTQSQLRNVVVRYGGHGVSYATAEVLVGASTAAATLSDVTLSDSQTTGIAVLGTATIDGSDITNNGKYGIYVDHGQVTVTRTRIVTNAEWGARIVINSSPYPAASTFSDDTITGNGTGGIYMWGATSTPTSSWPYGHENNIFDNNPANRSRQQLFSIGLSRTVPVDWSNNYWGPSVGWTPNSSACGNNGYLTFTDMNPGTYPAPTPVYTWTAAFGVPLCVVNVPEIGASGWSADPFGPPSGSVQIVGLANVSQVLRADATFTGHPDVSPFYQYQWLRCDATGNGCVKQANQNSQFYAVSTGDLGSTLRVEATAENAWGTTTVQSAPTPLVLKAINELAVEYRPALLFDSGEYWRPLSIDSLLAEGTHRLCVIWLDPVPSQPWCNGGVTSPDDFKHWIDPNTQQERDTYTIGPTAWVLLDLATIDGEYKSPTCAPSPPGAAHALRDCDDGGPAVIYYDYGQDGLGYRYLDYWIFYRDNTITGDHHEGDWEGLTVVLDGSSTDPRVAGALFAQHRKLEWRLPSALCWGGTTESSPDCVNGQPQGGGHVSTYVANGTHASYEIACPDDCPNPEGAFFPEGDHDGAAAWGMNSTCPGCVESFPVGGGEVWHKWPGHWGEDQAELSGAGESPTSPGTKSRYVCTEAGWNCPERQPGMPAYSARARAEGSSPPIPNPTRCQNWRGVSVAVLACDPIAIARAFRQHQTDRRGPFHILVHGRRSGDTLGLVQVLGKPLRSGEIVRFIGKPTPATSLAIRVQAGRQLFMISAQRLELTGKRAWLQLAHVGRPRIGRSSGVKLIGVKVTKVP